MTPKEVNEWKSGIIVFAPMIIIILLSALCGVLNVGTVFLGGIIGVVCGYVALFMGIVKNRVPE